MARKIKIEDYEWVATDSYTLTKPVCNTKITMPLKIALTFSKSSKSKGEALLEVGLSKKKAFASGQWASAFKVLIDNRIIEYNRKANQYKKSERYRDFMEYSLTFFSPEIKKKFNKEYEVILKELSSSLHFIVTL